MDGTIRKTRLLCVQPASDCQIRITPDKANGIAQETRPGSTRISSTPPASRERTLSLSAVDSAV